jgi:Mg/Co/Ni transporter MgtE
MHVKDFVRPAGQVRRDAAADALQAEFRRMEEQDCARYLWVTDADGKLVGWIDGEVSNGNVDMEEDLVVVDVADMSVKSGHSLKQALSMFVQQGVACLPVLDDQNRLKGEIRLADVLES